VGRGGLMPTQILEGSRSKKGKVKKLKTCGWIHNRETRPIEYVSQTKTGGEKGDRRKGKVWVWSTRAFLKGKKGMLEIDEKKKKQPKQTNLGGTEDPSRRHN